MNRYNNSNYRLLKHWDFILIDLILLELSFIVAYYIRFNGISRWVFWEGSIYRHHALILVLCLIFSLVIGNPYKNILKRSNIQEIYKLLTHTITMMVVDILCLFFIHEAGPMSRWLIGLNWSIYFISVLPVRMLRKARLRKKYSAQGKKNAMIVLTDGDHADELIRNLYVNPLRDFFIAAIFLTDYQSCYSLLLELSEDTDSVNKIYHFDGKHIYMYGIPIMGDSDDIIDYANHNWVDEVLLDTDHFLSERMNIAFEQMGITTHVIVTELKYSRSEVNAEYVEKLANYIVVSQSIRVVPIIQIFLKRFMDIVGGIVGCILTGIIFLFVAPAIYIKSPGPVFFTQVRVGKNGKTFKMYKFRSMYMDAEERKAELMKRNKIQNGMMFKLDDDPRIIGSEKKDKNGRSKGIGNFIRRTSLDEFPQFWNVLKGDMSLVGTRPPTIDEWEKYDPHHRARMSIRPGITGMWQISGRSNIVDFEKVVELDRQYIQTWTIGLDIQILAKTVLAVTKHEGAE